MHWNITVGCSVIVKVHPWVFLQGFKSKMDTGRSLLQASVQSETPWAEEVKQCFSPLSSLMFPRTRHLSASYSAGANQLSARSFYFGLLSGLNQCAELSFYLYLVQQIMAVNNVFFLSLPKDWRESARRRFTSNSATYTDSLPAVHWAKRQKEIHRKICLKLRKIDV